MNNKKPRRRWSFQSFDDLQQRQPKNHEQSIVRASLPIRQKPPISLIDDFQASVVHDEPLHVDMTSADQPIALDDQPLILR